MTSTTALEVQNVTRRFGGMTALNGLSFSVAPGQTVGLLGRNGAGKSTLLRILSGQLRANEGEVRLFGQPVRPESSLSRLCLIGDTPDFGKLSNIRNCFTCAAACSLIGTRAAPRSFSAGLNCRKRNA